ncbi:protein spaetzle 3-like [Eurosta solidaginis]|uniref:protein spaetzle 3-like n=1 Tax=Eurosta solidaginis TaxID=178769 RepID=UPI0035309CD9
MALTNFTLPFGTLTQPVPAWGASLPSLHPAHQLAANTNNLLYSPADHQQQQGDDLAPPAESDFYKNNPYAPPQLHQQQQQQPIRQSYQYNSNNNNNNENENQNNNRLKGGNTYLPPIPPLGARNTQQYSNNQKQQQHFSHFSINQQQQQQHQFHQQQQQQQYNGNNVVTFKAATSATSAAAAASSAAASTSTRTYGEGSYNNNFGTPGAIKSQQQPQQKQYYNSYSTSSVVTQSQLKTQTQSSQQNFGLALATEAPQPAAVYGAIPKQLVRPEDEGSSGNESISGGGGGAGETAGVADNGDFPHRPPGFTRVQAGQGSRTQVHAVLDYDVEEGEEEEYYDDGDKDANKKSSMPTVTPIQGPIFLKNGTAPVVPLFSYPTFNNGSFVQIPIWWTALSVALGLDVRGDVIKGVPCIKRYHQLYCPTAGNSYPIDKIERFIDDNKALMRRMYGDFEMNLEPGGPQSQTKKRKRRFIDDPDIFIPPGAFPAFVPDDDGTTEPHAEEAGESYFGKLRNKRQTNRNKAKTNNIYANAGQNTGRVDACESKVEIVTPYWASNSAGKIRAIVNTQHFEQAIHQEVCSKPSTARCERDCGCEQKYKWHRLLAYDPDNDCKGIFMDWFLFPSCCVCRCNP